MSEIAKLRNFSLPSKQFIRAFTSHIFKLFYFTITKVTLSIIPYNFTIHLTSQLLFKII